MPSALMNELERLPEMLGWHLLLTFVAMAVGVTVCVPGGIWASRSPQRSSYILALCGVVQTIPSLALLAVMVAVSGRIGFWPAVTALSLYSMLPIIRNTIVGLNGIDRETLDVARGIGLTNWQKLTRVELPMAAPVILGGIRTSLIWTVGTATLATPVGQPCLGNFIFRGLQTRNITAMMVGVIAAALVALILDALVKRFETGLVSRPRRIGLVWGSGACLTGILAIGVAMPAWTVWGGNWQQNRADGEISSVVRVGSKTFTEQYILGQLIRAKLEADGVRTEVVSGMGSAVLFDALRSGSIDVCVDYSGTLWANVLKRQDSPARDELYAALVQDLRSQFRIEVAGRLGFENTYALAVSQATANRFGLRTISDLARNAPQFSIAGDYEFFGRPEWQALQRSYGLQFRRRVPMDSTLMYSAVREEQVDVIVAFSTDGRLPAYNLVVLEDDKAALPPYDAVILVGPSRADDPRVMQTLRALSDSISPQAMREGNRRVDVDGVQPLDVGRQMASELP